MALPIIGVGGKLTSPVMIKTPRFLPNPTGVPLQAPMSTFFDMSFRMQEFIWEEVDSELHPSWCVWRYIGDGEYSVARELLHAFNGSQENCIFDGGRAAIYHIPYEDDWESVRLRDVSNDKILFELPYYAEFDDGYGNYQHAFPSQYHPQISAVRGDKVITNTWSYDREEGFTGWDLRYYSSKNASARTIISVSGDDLPRYDMRPQVLLNEDSIICWMTEGDWDTLLITSTVYRFDLAPIPTLVSTQTFTLPMSQGGIGHSNNGDFITDLVTSPHQ